MNTFAVRAGLTALAVVLALSVGGVAVAQDETRNGDDAFAPYVHPQLRVPVGDRRFHLICMGAGSPTVVLSAGLGDWSDAWRFVQPVIAKRTKVCTWDRAGHGFSDGSPEPQDVTHTESDLEHALAGANVSGPLVMVAHSSGSFETLLFADRHPGRVIGMVLVDPAYPDMEARLRRAGPAVMAFSAASDEKFFSSIENCIAALESGTGRSSPATCIALRSGYPEALKSSLLSSTMDPAYWRTYLSTFHLEDVDSKFMINSKRGYGNIPIVVLGSGILTLPDAPSDVQHQLPSIKAELERGHRALTKLSSRASYIAVPDSDHGIQIEKPEVVISAINEVLNKIAP